MNNSNNLKVDLCWDGRAQIIQIFMIINLMLILALSVCWQIVFRTGKYANHNLSETICTLGIINSNSSTRTLLLSCRHSLNLINIYCVSLAFNIPDFESLPSSKQQTRPPHPPILFSLTLSRGQPGIEPRTFRTPLHSKQCQMNNNDARKMFFLGIRHIKRARSQMTGNNSWPEQPPSTGGHGGAISIKIQPSWQNGLLLIWGPFGNDDVPIIPFFRTSLPSFFFSPLTVVSSFGTSLNDDTHSHGENEWAL